MTTSTQAATLQVSPAFLRSNAVKIEEPDCAGHGGGLVEDNVIEDDFEYDAVEVEQKAEPAAAVPEYAEYDEAELDLDHEAGDEYSTYAEEEEDYTEEDNAVSAAENDEDSSCHVTTISSGEGVKYVVCYDVCHDQVAGLWRITRRGWNRSIKKNWRGGRESKNIYRHKMKFRRRSLRCSIFFDFN